MNHWYAVFSKPRQEGVAEENLARQGFTTWLPRIRRSGRRKGRWVDLVEPLFPRYLFVQLDLERENPAPIRSTRGVSGLVRVGAEPAVVPDAVVAGLMAAVDEESGLFLSAPPVLRKGDRVRVLEGPFEGLQGIFDAPSGEARVVVLLDIIGRENRVSLARHQVKNLPD